MREDAVEPADDPLGLVFGGLAFGLALGLALQALVGFAVRTAQASTPPATALDFTSVPARILLFGTVLASLAAAIATWTLLAPIRNPWRQGMLAIITGLGSFALALVTQPVDRALGRPGLLVLAALAGAASVVVARRLRAGASS